jgi:hypothetical protein
MNPKPPLHDTAPDLASRSEAATPAPTGGAPVPGPRPVLLLGSGQAVPLVAGRPARVPKAEVEQIRLKDHRTDLGVDGGWTTCSRNLPPADRGRHPARSPRHSAEDASATGDTLLKMQTTIGSRPKQRTNDALGGEYFCGRGSVRKAPSAPSSPSLSSLPANLKDHYNASHPRLARGHRQGEGRSAGRGCAASCAG